MIGVYKTSPGATFGKIIEVEFVVEKAEVLGPGDLKRLNIPELGFGIAAISNP